MTPVGSRMQEPLIRELLVLSVLARIPGEEAPVLDLCLPTEPHGIQSPPAVGRAEGGTWLPGHSLSRCGLLLGIG